MKRLDKDDLSLSDLKLQKKKEGYSAGVLARISKAYKELTSGENPSPEIVALAYAMMVQEDAVVEDKDDHGGKGEEIRSREERDRDVLKEAMAEVAKKPDNPILDDDLSKAA